MIDSQGPNAQEQDWHAVLLWVRYVGMQWEVDVFDPNYQGAFPPKRWEDITPTLVRQCLGTFKTKPGTVRLFAQYIQAVRWDC